MPRVFVGAVFDRQGGRQKFLDFVGDGMKTENWSDDIKKHYKFENLADLQSQWLEWVKRGQPGP